MKKLVFFGIFLVFGLIGALVQAGAPHAGEILVSAYETGTPEERQAWLLHEAEEVKRGMRSSLPKGGGKQVGFKVGDSSVNESTNRINVSLQMTTYGVMAASQTETRKKFLKLTCPTYRRSPLAKAGVVLKVTIKDSRGGKLIDLMNSPRKCAA